MRYAAASWAEKNERDAYKAYISEALRMISESTAKYAGGLYMSMKWLDVINPPKTETRTQEQVVQHIMNLLKEVGQH